MPVLRAEALPPKLRGRSSSDPSESSLSLAENSTGVPYTLEDSAQTEAGSTTTEDEVSDTRSDMNSDNASQTEDARDTQGSAKSTDSATRVSVVAQKKRASQHPPTLKDLDPVDAVLTQRAPIRNKHMAASCTQEFAGVPLASGSSGSVRGDMEGDEVNGTIPSQIGISGTGIGRKATCKGMKSVRVASSAGFHILVAEDSSPNSKLMCRILTRAGHSVEAVSILVAFGDSCGAFECHGSIPSMFLSNCN